MRQSLLWVAIRLLFSRKTMFGGSAPMALLGVVLGVAALVASMAVMSGFENTLKVAMSDVYGHIQVVKRSRSSDNWLELEDRIRKVEPSLVSSMRFTFIEAVLARNGQISGVLIQGVDPDRFPSVLNFKHRVVSGEASIQGDEDLPSALLGKSLAASMDLKVGDTFKVVVPIADTIDPSQFRRKVGELRVRGIVDLGKYEYNERFILTDLATTQKIADIGDRYSGLILKMKDLDYAQTAAKNLANDLGTPYWIRDWRDSNENLFTAIEVERPGIFFVVLVIMIVAAFNVSATLSMNVVQRFKDIAILKTIGFSGRDIMKIFMLQGFAMGVVGLALGFALGLSIGMMFEWLQGNLNLLNGAVYRLDNIKLHIRFVDVISICAATLGICFVATIAAARKGAALNPVEGLRSE